MLEKLKIKLDNRNYKINKIMPFFILLLFILLNILIIFNLYFKENEKENILRLHVVANSDTIDDQITKLKVNEKISSYISELKDKDLNNDEIIENIKCNSNILINTSNQILKENNKNYTTSINIGKIYYDEKENMLLDMEKGNYNSIEVVLGNGKGKNIWTLISPSRENISNLKNLETILPHISTLYRNNANESSNNYTNYEYDIKIVEIFKNLTNNI